MPLQNGASYYYFFPGYFMTTKRKILGLIIGVFIIVLIISIGYLSFFIYKTYSLGNKITFTPGSHNNILDTLKSFAPASHQLLHGEDQGRINILLLGIGGPGHSGENLTDTIMIASLNPKTNQVALLSLPRDLYVQVPGTSNSMRINEVYQYGIDTAGAGNNSVDAVKKTISNITGLDIDYYIIMNFNGFIKVIDTIGGVNVMNSRDIHDPRYPGAGYSYETFDLSAGFHHLDGATALKYARERHDDPEGDFGRAKRQQQIIQSAKSKIFSPGTLLNVFAVNDIFNALGNNIKTDISPDEFASFWELAQKANTDNINNMVVDAWNKDSLLKVSHIETGIGPAFILLPRVGNWSEVQDLAANMFDLNAINRRKDAIASENAKVVIINKSGWAPLSDKIKSLLSDNFDYKNVIILNDSGKNLENNTFVYDPTGGLKPFTLDELIKKLPAQASGNLGQNYLSDIQNISPDLVVVLGQDIVNKYNMAEDSFDEYNKASDNE